MAKNTDNRKVCPSCSGRLGCADCAGMGQVGMVTCATCHGSGSCQRCSGTGMVDG